jgi:PKD repeat protein
MYINDRDAGDAVFGQGTWTFNPVMYYRIPGGTDVQPLCPLLAPNFAAELSDANPADCGYTTAPGTVLNEILTLSNLGTSTLTGAVSVVPAVPWLVITGAGAYSIPPGGSGLTFPVSMNATAMAESLYHADIQITHNDPTKTSPVLIPVDFVVQDSLKPNFVAFPVSGRVPLTVMFEPTHKGAANGFLWRFGDGTTSTLRNPIHTYTTPWVYDVRLLVSLDVGGCHRQDSIIKPAYITASSLRPQFAAEPKTGTTPLSVQFTDQSDGNPTGWYWDFGDGQMSAAQSPVHEYSTTSVFNVFLRVTDAGGQADSVLKLGLIRTDSILSADLVSELLSSSPRPGFDFTVWSSWTNQGTVMADNCTLRTLLPSEASLVLVNASAGYFKTGSYSGYSFAGDTIVIPLASLAATARFGGYIPIIAHLPPTVPIGTVITAEAWLSSSTAEDSLANNRDTLELTVVGSIDPNDKSALPEGEGADRSIGRQEQLTYRIDFENKATATAEAIYILVVDTLDPSLDWGSLAEGPSSHPDRCKLSVDPYSGVMTYFCDSIMLPPNHNPPEGEGYFTFSISPRSDLPNGARISNRAHIRFDYNAFMAAPDSGPVVRTIHFCDCARHGDIVGDNVFDVFDVIGLIDYAFAGGPAPPKDPTCPHLDRGDVNCDGADDVFDVVYLIDFVFSGGSPPCDPCGL